MVPRGTSLGHLVALSRSFRRQIDLLPSEYLRQFFRLKLEDDFRSINGKGGDKLKLKRVKRAEKDLRRMKAANAGKHKALDHILELAYGRKGKLKWELMQPFVANDPSQPKPERIIPAVEKSRPPIYPSGLIALLTSPHSRTTKPLAPGQVNAPPNLPARADPNSEDARLYGPFSKRREVNIRWRHYSFHNKRVLPPLQVSVETGFSPDKVVSRSAKVEDLRSIGVQGASMQDKGIYEELEMFARQPWVSKPLARRERCSLLADPPNPPVAPTSVASHLPRRMIQRAYRRLLNKIPVMCYSIRNKTGTTSTLPLLGRYTVLKSPHALGAGSTTPHEVADEHELAWVKQDSI